MTRDIAGASGKQRLSGLTAETRFSESFVVSDGGENLIHCEKGPTGIAIIHGRVRMHQGAQTTHKLLKTLVSVEESQTGAGRENV